MCCLKPHQEAINDFPCKWEEEQLGMSRVAPDPDSDDEVLAEILFRGKSISADGVVLVDFFSSESESDTDMENYIPPLPYGAFKDWEIVSCPPGNNYIHVYYQENRRRKYFTYLKELLPHVYREDLLLLRRRMNRYFRLNPDVDVGLDLWRDVNLLCQSLHSDDVEDFWRTQDEWVVSSWKLYPKSSVHVLDLTNGKTVYMFVDKVYPIRATLLERMLRHKLTVPPSYCRDVFVAGNVIQTVQTGLRQAYECLASAPILVLYYFGVSACTARQMVFSSPWLTAKKESGSPLQTALWLVQEGTALGKDSSNPLMVARLPKTGWFSFSMFLLDEKWLVQEGTALELASPEQTATVSAAAGSPCICWGGLLGIIEKDQVSFLLLEMFISADGTKWFLLAVQVAFLLIIRGGHSPLSSIFVLRERLQHSKGQELQCFRSYGVLRVLSKGNYRLAMRVSVFTQPNPSILKVNSPVPSRPGEEKGKAWFWLAEDPSSSKMFLKLVNVSKRESTEHSSELVDGVQWDEGYNGKGKRKVVEEQVLRFYQPYTPMKKDLLKTVHPSRDALRTTVPSSHDRNTPSSLYVEMVLTDSEIGIDNVASRGKVKAGHVRLEEHASSSWKPVFYANRQALLASPSVP
ncbi:hypothetical protein Tco_1538563 [Tanacetum coccineum]